MRVPFALAVVAAGAALIAAAPAGAFGRGGFADDRLPPVSGTIRLDHRAFGADGVARIRYAGRTQTGWSHGHLFGRSSGRQRFAVQQLRAGRYGRLYRLEQNVEEAYGNARSFQRPYRRDWWAGDGSGLVGLISRHVDGGEADTTGLQVAEGAQTYGRMAHGVPSGRADAFGGEPRRPEAPLEIAYGEPDLWSGYRAGYGGGVAPTGGLGYYGSGSPGKMAYYGSSSSAGPGGSAGGLGIYNSGSYGPGPHVIRLGQGRMSHAGAGPNCFCGPHIIHVGRSRHYASD